MGLGCWPETGCKVCAAEFPMQAGVGMVLGGDGSALLIVLPSAILLCLQVLSPYSRNRW